MVIIDNDVAYIDDYNDEEKGKAMKMLVVAYNGDGDDDDE